MAPRVLTPEQASLRTQATHGGGAPEARRKRPDPREGCAPGARSPARSAAEGHAQIRRSPFRHLARKRGTKGGGDHGFTIIEVLIAMVLLGIVLLGVQAAFTDHLIRQVGEQDRRTVALQLAADRLQAVQMDPVFGSLQTRYGGEEAAIDGYPGFRRTTTFDDVSEDAVHYKTVTVTVEHDALATPVSRTLTVTAP